LRKPKHKTRVTVDCQYVCTSDSKIKEASGVFSFLDIVPCTGVISQKLTLTHNITFRRNEDYEEEEEEEEETKTLNLKDLDIYNVYIEGIDNQSVS